MTATTLARDGAVDGVIAPPIRNAMTVDVEDYFQVQAFADVIPRADAKARE